MQPRRRNVGSLPLPFAGSENQLHLLRRFRRLRYEPPQFSAVSWSHVLLNDGGEVENGLSRIALLSDNACDEHWQMTAAQLSQRELVLAILPGRGLDLQASVREGKVEGLVG